MYKLYLFTLESTLWYNWCGNLYPWQHDACGLVGRLTGDASAKGTSCGINEAT